MKIRAEQGWRHTPLHPSEYQVDRVVELPNALFTSFVRKPLDRYEFIAENRVEPDQGNGLDHCLLVLGEDRLDGMLVQCGEDGRAMHTAFVPGARTVVQARLDQAADHIIRQGTERTASGSWCVYQWELDEMFDVTIIEGNGLDAMLKDTLERRAQVAAVEVVNAAVNTTFHPEFCTSLKAPASFSPERTAQLLDNAINAALELYEGEDLYTMLHGSFGLTIPEIREHEYLSDGELSETCCVPRQVLDGSMTVRDLLQLNGLSDRASLSHKDSVLLVPLEDLRELTPSGQEEYAALLDARVADIRLDDGAPELVLEGVEANELERFCDALEDHEQAEQAMGGMTP